VTVSETTAIAVSVATSAGVLRGVPHHLDVRVRILARTRTRGLVHHPQHQRPKTRPSPISRRRACSRPRRTRSRIRTERAPCSNTMSRLRLASLLLGGGFTFSRVMSKSVRSRPLLFFLHHRAYFEQHAILFNPALFLRCRRFAPYTSPKCVPHRS
jgi:hypothetical protein